MAQEGNRGEVVIKNSTNRGRAGEGNEEGNREEDGVCATKMKYE